MLPCDFLVIFNYLHNSKLENRKKIQKKSGKKKTCDVYMYLIHIYVYMTHAQIDVYMQL